MTAKLERLLAYLDQSDVTEVVLGLGRPIAVRADDSYRPVSSTPATREHIEALVQGTALAGLIDAPESRGPLEIEAYGRRLIVEVIRHQSNVALRITLASSSKHATNPPPTQRLPLTSTTPLRRATPESTTPMPASRPAPASTTPMPANRPVPASTTPMPAHRPAPASTTPIQTANRSAPIDTSPPERQATTPMPRLRPPTSWPPKLRAGELPAVSTVPAEPTAQDTGDLEVVVPLEPWTGPRIVDERSDVSALAPLIRAARQQRATDLHIAAGRSVMIRRLGELVPLDIDQIPAPVSPGLKAALAKPLAAKSTHALLLPMLGPAGRGQLARTGYVDLGVELPGSGRLRINISRQQDGLCAAIRLITDSVPTVESLGLPRELTKLVSHHQGLIVIAGPSGHGKTTTMAALVDLINSTKAHHIITIEDPVEIVHASKAALVSHREVGRHTLSFVAALRASLREDPDVVVIGELRDRETVEIALTAAETGHLVLATMSTPSAAKTIDRLIDMFPPDDQVQVRASISGTLRAVIAQRLLPTATGDTFVAAIELVTGVLPLAALIRDNKLFQLPNLMQRGRGFGMIRLDDSLVELVRTKRITDEVARQAAENKKELAAALSPVMPTQPMPRGLFGRKGPE